VAGIVLAGGKSERMGLDKATLPLSGTTMLDRAVQNLRQVTDEVIVVADRADKYDLPDSTLIIEDRYPETGPLGGILTGLERLGIGYHLVVACDMPSVKPDLLHLLLELAEGFDAAIPCVSEKLEPLCAAYRHTCILVFREILLGGRDYSVHRAVERITFRTVLEPQIRAVDPDLQSFINVNTLEDYERVQSSG